MLQFIVDYWWFWIGFFVTFFFVAREAVKMHARPPAEPIVLHYQLMIWCIMAFLWPITFPMLCVWWCLPD